MAVMSKKLFNERFGEMVPCYQLHWAFDKSCRKFIWTFYSNVFIGCVKFFFPLSILHLCLNYKHLEGPFYTEFLKTFMRKSSFAFLSGCCIFSWPCLMSNCFGGVSYYHLGIFPGLIASIFSLLGTRRARILDSILSVSMVLETFMNRSQYHDVFKITPKRLTAIFVLNNALLMYLLTHRRRERKSLILWFYVPPTVQENESKLQCPHENICFEYCFEGILKYFLIGYSWDIIRKLLTKNLSLLKQPQLLIEILKNSRNLKFGFFLGTYVGIYRALSCYLCGRRNYFKPLYFSLIAGLVSGLSFRIQPNAQLFCLSITTSLQLLYAELEEKYTQLKKLPTLLPLFLTCQGILVHERLTSPEICPKDYMNMTSLLTCGQVDNLCETIFNCAAKPME